jgi:peptidoglycan/LPS O-acetylase OafA/YrhL
MFAAMLLGKAVLEPTRLAWAVGGLECCCLPLALILGALSFAFWLWMLIDCIQHEPDRGEQKVVWVLVIVFTGVVGALVYYFVRKSQRPRY